jgi:MFS family permease
MLVCDGARAIVEAFTATMLLTGQMTLPMFFVTAAVFGAASAFFRPASTGLIPSLVRREHLQQANSLLGVAENGSTIVGPVVAGALVATVGPGWALALDAASYLASAAFLLSLRLDEDRKQARSFLAELAKAGTSSARAGGSSASSPSSRSSTSPSSRRSWSSAPTSHNTTSVAHPPGLRSRRPSESARSPAASAGCGSAHADRCSSWRRSSSSPPCRSSRSRRPTPSA